MNTTTTYHPFDLVDDRGREVGANVTIQTRDDGRSWVWVQPARARDDFGASIGVVVVADEAAALDEVSRRLTGMRRRVAKKFGAPSQ